MPTPAHSEVQHAQEHNMIQAQKEDNEVVQLLKEVIISMKTDIQTMTKEIEKTGSLDKQVIEKVVGENRPMVLELNQCTITVAREKLMDKVGDRTATLNKARAINKAMRNRLRQLQQTWQYWNHYMNDVYGKNLENDVLQVENRIGKMIKKCHTALSINRRYQSIKRILVEESIMMPSEIDKLLSALQQNKQELKDVKEIHAETMAMRKRYKKKLALVEAQTAANRKRREEESMAMKLKGRAQSQDLINIFKRKALTSDSFFTPEKLRLIEKTRIGILKYSEKFEGIKNGILISDVKLIIEAFVNSEDILCNLKSRKHDMEEKRQALWIEIEKQQQLRKIAQDRMQDFRERANREVTELKEKIAAEKKKNEQMLKKFEYTGELHVEATKAIVSIINKLDSVGSSILKTMSYLLTEKRPKEKSPLRSLHSMVSIDKLFEENHIFMDSSVSLDQRPLPSAVPKKEPVLTPQQLTTMTITDLMSNCALKLTNLHAVLSVQPEYQKAHVLIPCVLFHEVFEKFNNETPEAALPKAATVGFEGVDTKVLTREDLKKRSAQLVKSKTKPGK